MPEAGVPEAGVPEAGVPEAGVPEAGAPDVAGPVRVRMHDDVAVITVDHPPVNALSRAVRAGLIAALRAAGADAGVAGIVVTGGPGKFMAGADLREMMAPLDAPSLPDVVGAIEAVGKTVVAAVDGPALGGGLELALACDLRLAGPAATAGLPETQLGLIPGAGGTQLLPRLVGVTRAIELITQGQVLRADAARAAGLFDEVVGGDLVARAVAVAARAPRLRLAATAVPPGDPEAEAGAAAAAMLRARGVPAIAAAIESVRDAARLPHAEALAAERARFLALRDGVESRTLRHLFLAERAAAKVPDLAGARPRALARVAVIGAGTMGVGIAVSLLAGGLAVDLIERDDAASAAGHGRVAALLRAQIESGRLAADLAEAQLARVATHADWRPVADADLVIEAAFEDMDVKTAIFARLGAAARPGAILATNTSYLDVDAIAAASGRPADVLGLHFFAPAHAMRLLEVVRSAGTAPDVLATGLALGRRCGKVPVVARVGDGFIGNRVFAAYRRHAEYLLEDGASVAEIDAAMEAYGFAMGPFAVADLSGLDIAWAMRKRRAATRDPAERYVRVADRLCEAGRLGRKAGRGWYGYVDGKRAPDPEVDAIVAAERAASGIAPRQFDAISIQARLLAVLANEGAKVLAEGIAQRASDIDLVFVHGYGFPRLRGGPMHAADTAGLPRTLAAVADAARAGGHGSEPAPLLVRLAAEGGSFTRWTDPAPGAT